MPERARLDLYVSHARPDHGVKQDAPVADHFTKTCFLVGPNDSSGFEVYDERRAALTLTIIVLLEQRKLQLRAAFFHSLDSKRSAIIVARTRQARLLRREKIVFRKQRLPRRPRHLNAI